MNAKKAIATIGATLALGTGGVAVADNQVNPYKDKGTHFDLALISDIPQKERVEVHKDKAQMDIIGWNDEYKISIIPQVPASKAFGAVRRDFIKSASRPFLSKRMEYKNGDTTAFIEPKEGTENEFDIDFTVDKKPETNVFEYKLEGVEDFDFFYQPALTSEEISKGAKRPDNVVGSYAVYSKTKANHRIGSTNYATGKVAHIYRPKAIDANGDETWGELNIQNNILSVTIPQFFLDNATYPITVDPTFGNTSIGASSGNDGANEMEGIKVDAGVPSNAISVQSITVYFFDGPIFNVSANFKGVMTDSARTILTNGVGASSALSAASLPGWKTSSFSISPTLTGGDVYYHDLIGDSGVDWKYDSVSGYTNNYDGSNNFTTPTNPSDGSLTASDFIQSNYITYTTSVATPLAGARLIINQGQTIISRGQLIIQ